MSIVWTIIVGVIVGLTAKLLIPGRDPGGLLITALLGVAGAFIAHLMGRSSGLYSGQEPAGIVASVFGAILLLTLRAAQLGGAASCSLSVLPRFARNGTLFRIRK